MCGTASARDAKMGGVVCVAHDAPAAVAAEPPGVDRAFACPHPLRQLLQRHALLPSIAPALWRAIFRGVMSSSLLQAASPV